MMVPVVIKRIFPCSKRSLFDAWSQPALMMKWFFASQNAASTVKSCFRVGGHFEIVMHLPGGDFRHHGRYQSIQRYYHIAFSWNSHLVQNSVVALDFRELSINRTELTLTHSQLHDEEVRSKHQGGWDRCLANLELFLQERVETGLGDIPPQD